MRCHRVAEIARSSVILKGLNLENSVPRPDHSRTESRQRRGPMFQFILLVGSLVTLGLSAVVLRETNPTRSLVRSLRQGDESAQRVAASDLSNFGVVDLGIAIPALAEALAGDPSGEVRSEAARTLGTLGAEAIRRGDQPNRDQARDALISAIQDKDPRVREVALTMIPVLALAATKIADNENDVRLIGDPGSVVSKIFPALEDPDQAVRSAAATALGYFPVQLDPSLPMLMKAAVAEEASPNPRGRGIMGSLFRKVRPLKSSLPFLMESVGSDNPKVRFYAVTALGQMSIDAESAVPALIRIVKDPAGANESNDPGRAAATALGAIAPGTPKADEALAALKEVEASAPESRKRAIAAALRNFGTAP